MNIDRVVRCEARTPLPQNVNEPRSVTAKFSEEQMYSRKAGTKPLRARALGGLVTCLEEPKGSLNGTSSEPLLSETAATKSAPGVSVV